MKKKKLFTALIGVVVTGFAIVNCNFSVAVRAEGGENQFSLKVELTTDEKGNDCISLNWDDLSKLNTEEKYEYMVYCQKNGEADFQSIPAKASINVLNLYPQGGNNLKKWMDEPALEKATNDDKADVIKDVKVSKLQNGHLVTETKKLKYNYIKDDKGNFITNGMGAVAYDPNSENKPLKNNNGYVMAKENLINVTELSIKDANNDYKNKKNDLYKEEGKYYDVIYQGGFDSNNGEKLDSDLCNEIHKFIKNGGGYLTGHDTAYNEILNGDIGLTRMKDSNWYGDSSIKINKKGLLTTYPWNVGEVGDVLNVPMSHTGQLANGDVWFKYEKNIWPTKGKEINDPQNGTNNFYLTTKGNTAMIQTGHSNGQATPDEQKILANTIFYLSQITADTSLIDHKGDYDAPTKPDITNIAVGDKINISFNESTDPKTIYQYYVKGRKVGTEKYDNQSNTEEVNMTSGLRCYLLYCDNEENAEVNRILQDKINRIIDGREMDNKYDVIKNKLKNSSNTGLASKIKLLDKSDLEVLGFKVVNSDEYTGSVNIDKISNNFYAHMASIDNAGNISETSTKQYNYSIILDIESESQSVSKGNEVWYYVSLNNISKDNTGFEINDVKNILSQKIIVKYDSTKLKYNGACTFDRAFRILNEDDKEGLITFNLICRNINNYSGKANMLALSFDALNKGHTEVSISDGIITNIDKKDIVVLPDQLGMCNININ